MPTKTTADSKIRETAYLFWLEDGQPKGRAEEHWLRAVEALAKPRVAKRVTKTKAKTTK